MVDKRIRFGASSHAKKTIQLPRDHLVVLGDQKSTSPCISLKEYLAVRKVQSSDVRVNQVHGVCYKVLLGGALFRATSGKCESGGIPTCS